MANPQQQSEGYEEHIKAHWKFTLIGSAIGFGAIIAEMLYYAATDQVGKSIGDDFFEIVVNFVILVIFLLFLRMGIVEYEDIKHEIRMKENARAVISST